LAPLYELYGYIDTTTHYCVDNTWVWDEPVTLSERFSRYKVLKDALKKQGLELREDSCLCAEYVIDGSYSGPDVDGIVTGKSALDHVIFMMLENNYDSY
jgi:hypothetical protein